MKRVLLTTAPTEALIDFDGIGGNWYDKTDTYLAWSCALPIEDRISVTCPPTGLLFIQANVPDVHILQYPSWKVYLEALESQRWDMVGISFYTWSTPVAIEMAKMAKLAGVQEIWGGNYGVLSPGLTPYFSRLVKGPGEYPLHSYMYGRPLERIRHPAMLGTSSFRGISSKVGYLYSRRGCNIGCTFCSTPVFNPNEKPIDIDEINVALDGYQSEKVAHVIIYDETFDPDTQQTRSVIQALSKRGLAWICLTRADRIRGRIAELTDLGMDGAIIGIESLSDKKLKSINKREDVLCVRQTITELHQYNRRVLGTFMIGYERDDAEDIRKDIELLARQELYACQLTILTPFHGTRLYRSIQGMINEEDLSRFDLHHLVWNHPKIKPDEMRDIMAWAQKEVNRPQYIADRFKKEMKQKVRQKMASLRQDRFAVPAEV